jgi:hypothetical protein
VNSEFMMTAEEIRLKRWKRRRLIAAAIVVSGLVVLAVFSIFSG